MESYAGDQLRAQQGTAREVVSNLLFLNRSPPAKSKGCVSAAFGSNHRAHRLLRVFALPLHIRALKILDPALVEVPQPRRDLINQIVIVRHQQYCAFIPLQRNIQRIN